MNNKRWLWFIGLYIISILVVAGVAYLLRWLVGLGF